VSRGKRSEGSAAAGAAARDERDDSESSVTFFRSRARGGGHRNIDDYSTRSVSRDITAIRL
jgi:hypothetical protein